MTSGIISLKCWNCGHLLKDVPQPISRHANCANCFEVLRCCRMCLHYRDLDHIKCAEDRADPPVIKENANFCEFFKPARNAFDAKTKETSEVAKSRLDALFGGDTSETSEAEAGMSSGGGAGKSDPVKNSLDDLFDD